MKMMLSRPATGIRLVMAMRKDEVNQLTESNASRSVAIEPWIVVKADILDVSMKIMAHIEKQIEMPCIVERRSCPFDGGATSSSCPCNVVEELE